MKLIFAVLMSLGVATVAIAQQAAAPAAAPARPPGNPHAAVPLWANGAPGSEGKTAPEVVTGDADSGRSVTTVNNPSIAPYLVRGRGPNATPVAAIIIAPGGGHYKLTMDDEGYDVAKYLSGHGVAAFVLKYRLAHEPGSTYTVDGDDPNDRPSDKPAFQVLMYPGGLTPEINAAFNKDTPPAFLLCGADDSPAIAQQLPLLFLALKKAGVSAELHEYAGVGHGFGLRLTQNGGLAHWPDLLLEWMDTRGLLRSK
jgi:endo-1,4-beta-xylanase